MPHRLGVARARHRRNRVMNLVPLAVSDRVPRHAESCVLMRVVSAAR